jgi:hypothetical protein
MQKRLRGVSAAALALTCLTVTGCGTAQHASPSTGAPETTQISASRTSAVHPNHTGTHSTDVIHVYPSLLSSYRKQPDKIHASSIYGHELIDAKIVHRTLVVTIGNAVTTLNLGYSNYLENKHLKLYPPILLPSAGAYIPIVIHDAYTDTTGDSGSTAVFYINISAKKINPIPHAQHIILNGGGVFSRFFYANDYFIWTSIMPTTSGRLNVLRTNVFFYDNHKEMQMPTIYASDLPRMISIHHRVVIYSFQTRTIAQHMKD